MCLINIFLKRKKQREYIKSQTDTIQEMIDKFYCEKQNLSNFFIDRNMELQFVNKWRDSIKWLMKLGIGKRDNFFHDIEDIKYQCANFHEFVKRSNLEFIKKEKERCDALLSNIDGKSLDEQQREVVVANEVSTLVLAGAGSGKTLTIAGKVKYLCQEKGISPDDILLIAFTNKAAEEMTDRISNKLGIPISATTFHKLGLDIIKEANGYCPDIYEDMAGYIKQYFENKVFTNPELIKALVEYFAYYLQMPSDMEDFDSLGEVYEHEKSADFETIKSKYDKAQFTESINAEKVYSKQTLVGEQVKSLEEVSIANFLFLNGIKYEYEHLYPYESDDAMRRAYHPDFYLPDYDIYIEHFGIAKDGTVPWLSKIEAAKYVEDMQWKKEFHRVNGTTLVESYSYYTTEGCLLPKLEEKLKALGVEFNAPDYKKIFDTVYVSKSEKYFGEFMKLCISFISLFKSNGYDIKQLDTLSFQTDKLKKPYFAQRFALFKNIVKPILEDYGEFLAENRTIDFSDMINESTKLVQDGCNVRNYKYIIIDEFQDISVARYKLVKAIIERTQAKLLCVGDDWQSIYRFTGSDISIFTNFEHYFGYCDIKRIEKTYRNSQQLIDVASRFVTRNPIQLRKNLNSAVSREYPLVFIMCDDPVTGLKKSIDKIISEFGTEKKILLLGRTSYDFELIEKSRLFKITRNKIAYEQSPTTPIEFLTVHKAKGLEADNVILINFENATLGFPNKIADDPILETVLCSPDYYNYAEERRLFYVAITRTKNRVFIITDRDNPSEFFKEFHSSDKVYIWGGDKTEKTEVLCPRCKTGHLLLRDGGKTGKFVGCSNYPRCEYTEKNLTILSNPRICPHCGGFLVDRKGIHGHFLGCTNYPKCNYTQEYNERPRYKIGF